GGSVAVRLRGGGAPAQPVALSPSLSARRAGRIACAAGVGGIGARGGDAHVGHAPALAVPGDRGDELAGLLAQREGLQVRIVHEERRLLREIGGQDRKSTRLNSSHVSTSYAVFCLKKTKEQPSRD